MRRVPEPAADGGKAALFQNSYCVGATQPVRQRPDRRGRGTCGRGAGARAGHPADRRHVGRDRRQDGGRERGSPGSAGVRTGAVGDRSAGAGAPGCRPSDLGVGPNTFGDGVLSPGQHGPLQQGHGESGLSGTAGTGSLRRFPGVRGVGECDALRDGAAFPERSERQCRSGVWLRRRTQEVQGEARVIRVPAVGVPHSHRRPGAARRAAPGYWRLRAC